MTYFRRFRVLLDFFFEGRERLVNNFSSPLFFFFFTIRDRGMFSPGLGSWKAFVYPERERRLHIAFRERPARISLSIPLPAFDDSSLSLPF
jgi:hypothetical protein